MYMSQIATGTVCRLVFVSICSLILYSHLFGINDHDQVCFDDDKWVLNSIKDWFNQQKPTDYNRRLDRPKCYYTTEKIIKLIVNSKSSDIRYEWMFARNMGSTDYNVDGFDIWFDLVFKDNMLINSSSNFTVNHQLYWVEIAIYGGSHDFIIEKYDNHYVLYQSMCRLFSLDDWLQDDKNDIQVQFEIFQQTQSLSHLSYNIRKRYGSSNTIALKKMEYWLKIFQKYIKKSIIKEEYYHHKLYPINQIEGKLQSQMKDFIVGKVLSKLIIDDNIGVYDITKILNKNDTKHEFMNTHSNQNALKLVSSKRVNKLFELSWREVNTHFGLVSIFGFEINSEIQAIKCDIFNL